jgi:hypothetical protein
MAKIGKLTRIIRSVTPVTAPRCLQLDTTTVCNLGTCIYCNPHGVGWASKPENMSINLIKSILIEAAEFGTIYEIRSYVNGDPLCEPRINQILQLCEEHLPETRKILYSNGADISHIDRITGPLVDELHISVSAATPETYLRIHGKPLFGEVKKTYYEALNRGVKTYVHYISCKQNQGELGEWRRVFSEARQLVSAVHETMEQTSSHGKVVEDVPESTMNSQDVVPNNACNCFNNLSIGVHGEIMECPDCNYIWNYGIFPEVGLHEAWKKRILSGLMSPPCRTCNLRSKYWRTKVRYTQMGLKLFG